MLNGKIEQSINSVESDILIVDAELLFTVKRKWYGKKTYEINNLHRKVVRFLKAQQGRLDAIVIGCAHDFSFVQDVVNTVLLLPYSVIDLKNERNYKNWLRLQQPKLHLAIKERNYYTRVTMVAETELK
jgi:glutamate racemase